VPGKLRLLFEEESAWGRRDGIFGVVESDGYGEGCRTESDAEEIEEFV
jgi:hypothetical protein